MSVNQQQNETLPPFLSGQGESKKKKKENKEEEIA